MMPSLRKKVAGFIRQLSVSNQADNVIAEKEEPSGSTSGCFIQRYLSGHDVRQSEPIIIHGRNPHELPRKALGSLLLGPHSVFAAVTGPDGGLTTVNQRQRHLSTSDPDVDYIDILEQQAEQGRNAVSSAGGGCVFSPGYDRWFTVRPPARPLDNSVMHIRAAGSVFSVGKRSVHTSVSDLPLAVTLDASSRGKNASLDFELDGNYDNNNLSPSAHDYSTFNFSGVSDGVGAGGGVYLRGVTVGSATYGCNTARLCDDNDVFLPLAAKNRDKESRVFVDERELGPAHVLCSNLTPVELNGNSGVTEEVVIDEYLVIPPPAEYAGGNLTDNDAAGFTPIRKSKSAPPPLSAREASMGLGQRLESAHSAGSGPRLGEIAGVSDWSHTHQRAYGAATTLYERHPLTQENAGNPIADCFAVVARRNSAILAIADGVNWGEKACVAARSAIHGCVDYLNKAMFSGAANTTPVTNTTEVFVALLRSFHAAHNLILQEDGMLTTLTTAVVLPLISSERYVVCVCNVGDSLAYVYSATHGVREITKGSHDIHCMRDMRDALGALGPVDGQNPELNNLTCSLTEVENGDIVFLTSDGVSDNFDPVVGKFAVLPPSQSEGEGFRGNTKTRYVGGPSGDSFRPGGVLRSPGDPLNPHNSSLPTVQAYQRHELSLLRMDDLLKHGVSGQGPPVGDAQSLCELLLDFSTRLTAAKRHILEDPDLYYTVNPGSEQVTELSRTEQRTRRKKACEKLVMVPGKLDHATVVAYTVGEYKGGHSPRDGKTNQSDELLLETVL